MKKNFYQRFILLLFSLIIFFLYPFRAAGQEQETTTSLVINHTPISTFTRGEMIRIEASVTGEIEWMRFFFRYEGLEQFQVRNMEKEGDSTYAYQFDTSQLTSLELEYYLAAKIKDKDKEIYFPSNAPAEALKVSGQSQEPLPEIPSDIPPPEEEEKKFKFPISAEASIQAKLIEKEAVEDEKWLSANGNLRIFHSYQGDFNLDIDSNLSYTNTPSAGERSFDLSNMMLSLSKDKHTFRAGDISINESEYTVSGLGRRGVEYIFDNQKAYLHLFDVSSQQVRGFEGFGIPKSNISILGGAFGYKFFKDKLAVKAVYLAGKDDPNQGINIGFSPSYESRKGNAISLTEEAKLFQDKLNLRAEIGRTSYDGDLSDDQKAISDTAFNIGGNFSHGIISMGTSYRYVGKDFNSVGYQSFTNDRKGYETNIGLVYKRFNLSASYTAEHDNVKNDPAGFTTNNKNGIVNLSVGLSDKVTLELGYNRDKQNTFQGEMETTLQDSLTNEYRSGLNLILSPSASFSLSLTNSVLSSVNDATIDTSTFTFNLTGSFRCGQILTLNPVLGYSIANKKFAIGDSETYNSFLTGEIIIVPQVFSMFFSGSFSRVEIGALDITNTFEFGGGLNLQISRLVKIGSVTFSLRGNYRHTKMIDFSESDYRILFQTDFSF